MASKIKITFLGTSDATPSARRNHTSIFLNYGAENILIDCGEGTQRQFRKAEVWFLLALGIASDVPKKVILIFDVMIYKRKICLYNLALRQSA